MEALPVDQEINETNYSQSPLGESSKSCCKVSNRNACGSGSLVGVRNGKSLVLTNAHVAGTRIGHTVVCTFPFANNKQVRARVIMAGYSDRVMMDWAVLELEEKVELPHIKLSIDAPTGEHYTGGYPRCRGPYFQELRTTRISHGGTVWRWQPNSIGGQSGSGVHSPIDDKQRGLLTWSWGGDGAGQTTRSIYFQYANRAEIGFARPEGLIELNENRADDLESGFFTETNITTLPIWDHLDDGDDDDDDDGNDGDCDKPSAELAAKVLKQIEQLQKQVAQLAAIVMPYKDCESGEADDEDDTTPGNGTGPLFGM